MSNDFFHNYLLVYPNKAQPPSIKCGVTEEMELILSSEHAVSNSKTTKTWPWMVSLGYRNKFTNQWNHICGGTIISDYHILTAAHCCKALENNPNITI